MQKRTAPWYARLWPWHTPADDAAVRRALQDVSGLEPAVVVTGGSRGIGLAIARRFLQAGHQTAIVARNAVRLEEAVAELKASTGADAIAILCDVTEPSAYDVIATALNRNGLYLDILVNNAGTGLAGPFATHSEADLFRLVALNVATTTRLTREALPAMLERQRGGILNVASLGASVPGPNQAAYYASKSYVVSLTEAIASENAGQGVRIAALLPGPVTTAFHEEMGAEQSLYRYLLPPMSAESVANSAYRWFMFGNRVIVPGIFNVFFFVALKILPHALTVPLIYWLLRKPDALNRS
ncbi:MAG: SDR family NAD(P)-dependent oxidoreductase [Hyphomicrobium sp.]|uniref:SDR family NAD(P)-dependent oxidoreductase n=1 Tax=Hyphomicrobium sp. TaxID=82 RepID=UPI0039E2B83B